MSKQTALAKRATLATEIATRPVDIEMILTKAAEGGMSLEGIERLMVLRKELKLEAQREAYLAALSAFQAECPPVEKTVHVYNKNKPHTPENIRYSFAPLEEIEATTAPYCKKFGLSYTFRRKIDTKAEEVTTYCVVHHVSGYSTPLEESGSFTAPIDPEAYMSKTQKYGSAGSFSKRYALVDALAVKIIGEDDDGGQGVEYDETERDRADTQRAKQRFEDSQKRQPIQQPRSTKGTQQAPAGVQRNGSQKSEPRINDQQVGVIQTQMDRAFIPIDSFKKRFGYTKLQEIPLSKINEVLAWIRNPT